MAGGYLERLDKHFADGAPVPEMGLAEPADEAESRANLLDAEQTRLALCGGVAVRGECACGVWQKVIRCGREWCPTCGQEGSERHLQRYARWLARVQKLQTAGYWVITFPPNLRDGLKSRAALDAAKRTVVEWMKAQGYSVGAVRWHFVGDRHPDVWHPHLNVLVPGRYIPRKRLAALKASLREALGLPPNASIHYSYRDTPAKLCHLARYITKPHWGRGGLAWETDLALELHGWHNDAWWGRWTALPEAWALEGEGPTGALIALGEGRCPVCAEAICWRGRSVRGLIVGGLWEEKAPGYWYKARAKVEEALRARYAQGLQC